MMIHLDFDFQLEILLIVLILVSELLKRLLMLQQLHFQLEVGSGKSILKVNFGRRKRIHSLH